jgi:hypothetical protein
MTGEAYCSLLGRCETAIPRVERAFENRGVSVTTSYDRIAAMKSKPPTIACISTWSAGAPQDTTISVLRCGLTLTAAVAHTSKATYGSARISLG